MRYDVDKLIDRPRREVERNPFGFSISDILLLGGVFWFSTSSMGRTLLKAVFPGGPSSEVGDVGVGSSTGEGGGGVLYPKTPTFRLVATNWDGYLWPGSTMHVDWTISHIGPPGAYVVGLDIAPAHVGCIVGMHNSPIQTLEADIEVGADGAFTNYSASASQTLKFYQGIYDTRTFVRDTRGNVLASEWRCGTLAVL